MSDEPQVIRGVDWRSTFPFTLIFRSFRVAIHPSKLLLALIALILIYVGGRVLDRVWLTVAPRYRAVPNEMLIFEESRDKPDQRDAFNVERNAEFIRLGELQRRELRRVPKPNATLRDYEWWIKQDREARVRKIEDDFGKSSKGPSDSIERDRRMEDLYDETSRSWRAAHSVDGIGLFETFLNYELGRVNTAVRMARAGNFVGPGGAAEALVHFFIFGPLWAVLHHQVYFVIFGLWFLTVWSIFGGAIARIAAVHVARDEKISIRQALAFSLHKFLSFISAPLIPLVIVVVVGLVVALGGLIGNIPGIGPIIVGGLFFLALAAGFIMALVLLGTIGGINLMYPTIAVEGSDSFDAISRSFSYLYARPWRLAFYTVVALIYGSICYLFVRFFIYLMLWLSHQFTGLGFRWLRADNAAPLWNVMWPDPMANGRLIYEIDFLTLGALQSVGAWLLAIWIYLTISMLGAFAISFYFSANTVIYYLMRNEVDATELDDVYLEQSDEDFSDTGGAAAPASDAGAPSEAAESSAEPSESSPS